MAPAFMRIPDQKTGKLIILQVSDSQNYSYAA